MQGLGFLAKSFLAVSDPKITDLAWGKKVRGVFPDRLISKKCSFIWKFTRRTLKTEHVSSVFDVFDPLRLQGGVGDFQFRNPPAPPTRPTRKQHFEQKTAFRVDESVILGFASNPPPLNLRIIDSKNIRTKKIDLDACRQRQQRIYTFVWIEMSAESIAGIMFEYMSKPRTSTPMRLCQAYHKLK